MSLEQIKDTSQSDTSQNTQSRKTRLRRFVIAAYIIALTSFAAVVSTPLLETVTVNESHDILRIAVPVQGVRSVTAVYAVAGALILLAAGIALAIARRTALAAVTMLIAPAGFGGSHFAAFMVNLSPWTTEAEILAPDGNTYYFMDSSFMQGQRMAIARLKSETLLRRIVDVQGTAGGDVERRWAPVIRPAGAPQDDYGQLYLTDANMIIGIRYDHKCYLAYDIESDRFYGRGDIQQISPFALIGPNTPMCQSDIEGVIADVQWWIEFLSGIDPDRLAAHLKNPAPFGYPTPETLRANLAHPNPKVTQLCRRILKIHQTATEMLNKRLSTQQAPKQTTE